MRTAPATIAPKKANRCSQPRMRGRVSGCSQSLSAKSAAVQDLLDLLALLEDGGDRLLPRRLDLGAVGLHPDGLAVVGTRQLMHRGYGAVGWAASGRRCELAASAAVRRPGPALPGAGAGPRVARVGARRRVRDALTRSTNAGWPAPWRAPTSPATSA